MGRPTVLVATVPFAALARQVAASYGMGAARIAVVEHPLGGIAEERVVAHAAAAVEQLIGLLAAGRV